MILDPRFLTLHPATAAWWQQRDKCRQCAHRAASVIDGERCTVAEHKIVHKGVRAAMDARGIAVYCIDARASGGDCGPAAKLFKEIKA